MQDFLSPYFLVALSGVFAVLALYLPLRLQRALRKSAFLDPLTGLANRLLLMDRFEVAMRHAKRSRKKFAMLMLDLVTSWRSWKASWVRPCSTARAGV